MQLKGGDDMKSKTDRADNELARWIAKTTTEELSNEDFEDFVEFLGSDRCEKALARAMKQIDR